MKNLLKKNGELKAIYKNVISEVYSTKIYTDTWTNNGRNLRSISFDLEVILNTLGYKYKKGNDAPRGGAEGNYIKISKTAFNKLKSLV